MHGCPAIRLVWVDGGLSLILKADSTRTFTRVLAAASFAHDLAPDALLRAAPLDATVTVRSEVKQPGKERMTLDYELEETPARWKIYGVKVAGVCLITTYRDVFAEKVHDGGVDGLIAFLADATGEAARDSMPSKLHSGKSPGLCMRSSKI